MFSSLSEKKASGAVDLMWTASSWCDVNNFLYFVFQETSFQVVLISGGSLSFVLMNYGDITPTNYRVEAGYDTNLTDYFVSLWSNNKLSSTDLKYSSNVNVPGRWAFVVISRDHVVGVRMKVMARSNLKDASNQQILLQQFQDELKRRGLPSTLTMKVKNVRGP
ncbi:hypothetical protein NFI96_016160 [Prochilodus magdalenae]|nr:hypothetical protein NFI96_016160 [Prochilodus magdalenae]